MKNARETKKKLSANLIENLFLNSTVLIGVCLTVISLFQITDKKSQYLVDDILTVASVFFLAVMVFAWIALQRSGQNKIEQLSNVCFFIGIVFMLISGVFLYFNL